MKFTQDLFSLLRSLIFFRRWTAPRSDGGSRVTGYSIELLDCGSCSTTETPEQCRGLPGSEWRRVYYGRSKEYTVSKLAPATAYRLRLAALNHNGQRSVQYSCHQQTIAFYDIIFTICVLYVDKKRYQLCILYNLENNTSYYLHSEWSHELACATFGVPPPQPAPPTLECADVTSLTLTWPRVCPTHSYILRMEEPLNGHGFIAVYRGSDNSFQANSLRRNSDYKFKVKNVKQAYCGKFSVYRPVSSSGVPY